METKNTFPNSGPLREMDKAQHKTRGKAFMYRGVFYARRTDGFECYMTVNYNHSTRPEFLTEIYTPHPEYGFIRGGYFRHPKSNGVTKSRGWELNPEWVGGDW